MKSEQCHFVVRGTTPPTIEVDSCAAAVYIRFKKTPVAKTVDQDCESMHVAVDLDERGEVVGIEAVGIREFSLGMILKKAFVEAPKLDFSRACYIPAGLAVA